MTQLVANDGGLVPNFITMHLALLFMLQGLCHDAPTGVEIFMINKVINNYSLKKFGDKDQEVVVIHVEACGT